MSSMYWPFGDLSDCPDSSTAPDRIRSLGAEACAIDATATATPAAATTSALRIALPITTINPRARRKSLLRAAHGRERPRVARGIAERRRRVAPRPGVLRSKIRLRQRVDAH